MNKRPLIFVGSRDKMNLMAIVAELNGYEILGILDSHYYGRQDTLHNLPLIGDERWLLDPNNLQAQQWLRTCDFFLGNWWYGNQHINHPGPDMQLLRLDRINVLEQSGANVVNLIHPRSRNLSENSKYATIKLGKGIYIDDDCWYNTFNVEIGNYCSISMNTRIAGNAKLGFNVCVGPDSYLHHCDIGDNSYIGMQTKILLIHTEDHMIKIGKNCTTWVSSELFKDMPDHSIHTNTGRILKKIYVPEELT